MTTLETPPVRRSTKMRSAFVASAVGCALLLPACSSTSTTSTTTTAAGTSSTTKAPSTSAPGTTAGTTAGTTPGSTPGTAVAGAEVAAAFASPISADLAKQASLTMVRRLEKYGYAGSKAPVNSAGTGLTITVAGVTSTADAKKIVEALDFRGVLYFRPAVAGPFAPAPGETASPKTAEILTKLGFTETTLPTSPDPTTAASADVPTGTSMLTEPDQNGAVIARWQVGPASVGGDAVVNTKATVYNGAQAVQITLKPGASGIDLFNTMASACHDKAATCPTGVYTMVFDSYIATVSTVQKPDAPFTPFAADGVIIWSPEWTADHAKVLAVVAEAGALPVDLVVS